MATIDLGKIKIVWKGTYANGTAYVIDEAVVHSGTSYICIANTTGNTPPNGTYWNVLAQAGTNGTNGTDLSTTLTTRGDIVFKGASALTRLPKGTAGYYLKQGANDPEWGVISGGDVVKLATVTVSSAASVISIDGNGSWVDNSVYGSYTFIIQNLSTTNDSNSSEVFWRMNHAGSQVSAEYYSIVATTDANSGSSSSSSTKRWNDNSWGLSHNNMDAESSRSGYGKIEILSTGGNNIGGSGSHICNMMSDFISHHSNSSTIYRNSQMGYLNNDSKLFSGISIYPTGGNIDEGIITVYGRKR